MFSAPLSPRASSARSFNATSKCREPPLDVWPPRARFRSFNAMISASKKPGGCPVGPMIDYYDDVTKHEDPVLTAKLATAAWWGGQGNTLPSTVWTFGKRALPKRKMRAFRVQERERGGRGEVAFHLGGHQAGPPPLLGASPSPFSLRSITP